MPSWFCKLRDIHLKLEKNLHLNTLFLCVQNCAEKKAIPHGLKLHFNLSFSTNNGSLAENITEILNFANSRILDTISSNCKTDTESVSLYYTQVRRKLETEIGLSESETLINDIISSCQHTIKGNKDSLTNKLSKLQQYSH